MPLAFEHLGRLGVESRKTLETLANSARTFGTVGRGARLVQSWRTALERIVVWNEADTVLQSLGRAGCIVDCIHTNKMREAAHSELQH